MYFKTTLGQRIGLLNRPLLDISSKIEALPSIINWCK